MVLQSRYRSLGFVLRHLYGQEVDLQLLELSMLLLEIFYIHSTCELGNLWANVTLESRIILWPLPLCSPLRHKVFLSEHCYQFFRNQCIWGNVDWVVTCNAALANVDSVDLIKIQFLSVIFKLLCVLNLSLYRLYPENFRTLYFFDCQKPWLSFQFQLFTIVQESLYQWCNSQELSITISVRFHLWRRSLGLCWSWYPW